MIRNLVPGFFIVSIPTVSLAQGDLRVGAVVVSRTIPEYDDEFTLNLPESIAKAGDTLAVADVMNRRVVLFDARTLKPLRTFGQLGAGPGEFRNPLFIQITPTEFIVGDGTLSRLSYFSRDGRFERTESLPERDGARSFVVRGPARAILLSQSSTHYLKQQVRADSFASVVTRVTPLSGFPAMSHGSLVVAGAGGSTFVVDGDSGFVIRLDSAGGRTGMWRAPRFVIDEVNRLRTGTMAANPGIVFASFPMFVSANQTPNGELFLFRRRGDEVVALLFNPENGSFRRMISSSELKKMDTARAAYFDGTRLYIVHDDGLRVFAVEPATSRASGSQ